MVRSTAYTFLVVGLASQILAEPVREPYQPSLARMSTRDIIGLHRRDTEGYSPTELLCGEGDTCAEACGKGFAKCNSKDHLTHCYNPSKKQECCPNGSGDSCDKGYFCSADEDNKTWCCPDGLSLKECAQKYDIPGPLTSQSPSTTTSTTKSKTTTKATTTKDTSSEASHTSTTSKKVTTTKETSTKESTKEPTSTTTKVRKPESTKTSESTSTTVSKTTHHHSTSKTKTEETSTTKSSTISTTTSTTTLSTVIAEETTSSVITPAVTAQTVASDPTTSSAPPAATTSSVDQSGSGINGPTNSLILFIVGALAAFV